MKDQKKAGVLISYLNIALNMIGNFLLIPLMIGELSQEEYSIYKIMQSLAGPLIMLNLGISTIAARAVVKYRSGAGIGRKEKENTLAMTMLISCAMAALVIVLSSLLRSLIPELYGNTYRPEMLEKAQRIFSVFAVTMALRILNETFKGCILGNERFVCFYGETAVQNLLHIGLIGLLLHQGADALAVALVDLVICGGLLVFNGLYAFTRLGERLRLHSVDYRELKHIAAFSLSILMQAVVNQVNSNLDMVILGTFVIDKRILTAYSSALSIYTIYSSVLSVFVNAYFPKAARLVMNNCSNEALTDHVIEPGRIQAIIALGILMAFALFGGNFVSLWIGNQFIDAHPIALLLMTASTLPLVQNPCQTILDARLKRLFSSVAMIAMAAINVTVSLILIKPLGFWGAAWGTVISVVLGHWIVMNLYYHRVMGLNVPRMLREIFRGILPASIFSGIICIPVAIFLGNSLGMFLIKCMIFVSVYAAALWHMGLIQREKTAVVNLLRRKTSR